MVITESVLEHTLLSIAQLAIEVLNNNKDDIQYQSKDTSSDSVFFTYLKDTSSLEVMKCCGFSLLSQMVFNITRIMELFTVMLGSVM